MPFPWALQKLLVGLPHTRRGLERFPRTAEGRRAMVIHPAFDLALE